MAILEREQSKQYWDTVSADFNIGGQFSLWRRHSDWINQQLLREWMPDTGADRVLKTDLFDEAATDGLYPELARHRRIVFGIDISGAAVAAARQRHSNLLGGQADLRALPFSDGRFDHVISNSSLDHFETRTDFDRALQELIRVLKPGGQLIISLDNPSNPLVWLRNHLPFQWLNRLGLVPYYVGFTQSRRQLADSLQRHGLEVLDRRAIMHCPRVWTVARAKRLGRQQNAERQQQFLARQQRWERRQGRWGQYLTGHFIALRARKPA